jgi:hypothetical protein
VECAIIQPVVWAEWIRTKHRVAVRVISHVVVWTILLIPAVIQMYRGWRPVGDNATISVQSFKVLSLHPPLLGQYSTISSGAQHTLFDPGPLQYVLLAVPVHLDPLHGGLWGGAIVSALILSVAIEALWRTGFWLGCAAIAFCLLDMAWLLPGVVENIMWNPYMGLPFVLASVALAWVVGIGSMRWWPVLVFTASVAAQTEVLFAAIAVALAILSPLIGLAHSGRPDRPIRTALIGIGVGVVCWIAPVIQQTTGQVGNISAFVQARGSEPSSGLGFGLKSVAFVVWPLPVWLRRDDYIATVLKLGGESRLIGLLVLLALVTISVWSWMVGRRDLASLAAVSLIGAVSATFTYANVPVAHLINLQYLILELWIVGLAIWITVFWALAELGVVVVAKVTGRRPETDQIRILPSALVGIVLLAVGIAVVRVLPSRATVETAQAQQIDHAVAQIDHLVPTGPVNLAFGGPKIQRSAGLRANTDELNAAFNAGTAIAFQLTTQGRSASLPYFFTALTGIAYTVRPDAPTATIEIANKAVLGVVVHRPR